MLDPDILAGKKIIITGGNSGIGKTLAFTFSEMGADVGIIARTQEKLEEVAHQITGNNHRAIYACADTGDYTQSKTAIDFLISDLGDVDVLINNAGIFRRKNFVDVRPDQIDSMINTDLKGVLYGCHAVLPYMLEHRGKKTGYSIINTSSVSSLMALDGVVLYATAKAGINHFTRCLSFELKQKKIRVNAILPSFVDTPMMHYGNTDENVKAMNPITPEFLIPYFTFFASDLSDHITGQLVNIEDFRFALPIIKEIMGDSLKSWEEIESLLKEQVPQDVFLTIKTNKKLLNAIL